MCPCSLTVCAIRSQDRAAGMDEQRLDPTVWLLGPPNPPHRPDPARISPYPLLLPYAFRVRSQNCGGVALPPLPPRYALQSAVENTCTLQCDVPPPPLSSPRQSVQALAVLSLPAVLSPLSPPRVAYRLPHLSVSRVAFASARAQPPSHADDRPVGPPSGPNACRAVAERQSRGRRARPDRSDSPACSRSSRAA